MVQRVDTRKTHHLIIFDKTNEFVSEKAQTGRVRTKMPISVQITTGNAKLVSLGSPFTTPFFNPFPNDKFYTLPN